MNEVNENDPDLKEYKIGDVVWMIVHGGNGPIAVKCKITEVDDYFRKQNPTSYLFYDVDEPVGHSLPASNLFEDGEGIIEDLRAFLLDNLKEHETYVDGKRSVSNFGSLTLEQYRRDTVHFIVSTWGVANPQEEETKLLASYPDKKQGDEWFNCVDCLAVDRI